MVLEWHYDKKGTTQGSVSGPYLFNLFINDLDFNENELTFRSNYFSDDSTFLVKVCKAEGDLSDDLINQYFRWSGDNCMPCNVNKCSELTLCKKTAVQMTPVQGIKQVDSSKILGVTFQNNNRFIKHVEVKLLEVNKCLYVLRCLRKEGYRQHDIG